MGATIKTTRLGRIQTALSEALLEALKGEPLVDADGAHVIVDGKLVLGPVAAGILKEAREYLKAMGITEECEDAEYRVIHEVVDYSSKYSEDQDALLNTLSLDEPNGGA